MPRAAKKKERLNSRLEAEGAEFLVLGNLLIEGIASYKHYVNGRGYDLVVNDPKTHRSAQIQVKSRWATDAGEFLLRSVDNCDFVVFVRLNRGNRYSRRNKSDGKTDPTFYVVPSAIAKRAIHKGGWGKVRWDRLGDTNRFKNAWSQIRDFLARPTERYPWEGRVELGQRIVGVDVPKFPKVKLTFADGYKATFDFTKRLKRGAMMAPLRRPSLFRTAHPGSSGGSLEWIGPNGEEIDFCADSLRMEAEGIWDPERQAWKI
jgi:hypothetical protein